MMASHDKIDATQPPAVLAAINAVMAHCAKEGISKARKNQQQGYAFRGIDDVYNALCGVLADNKIVMLPFVQDMRREERQTKGGGVLNYTILTVDFKIACSVDGSFEIVRVIGEAMDSADKSSNKAQSAALKYAAIQVFMIPTEGDNDADAHTPEVAAREPARQQQKPVQFITDDQRTELMNLLDHLNVNPKAFFARGNITDLRELPAAHFAAAKKWINDTALAQRDAELKKNDGAFAGVDASDVSF